MDSALHKFPFEILYLLGIIANVVLFIYFRKKCDIKKISYFISTVIFSTCAGYLLIDICIDGFKNSTYILKFLVNVFMLFFIFSIFKLIKKAQLRSSILNSILLGIAFFSSLAISVKFNFLAYLFFEGVAFGVYQFASWMRSSRKDIYSPMYVLISVCATSLFMGFFLISLLVKDPVQLAVLQVCMAIALLLKIGIFPFYNYLIQEQYEQNILYAILLFSYLPFVGVIVFNKLSSVVNLTNETYQITLGIFLFLCFVSFALRAFRTKDIVKFGACCAYFFASIAVLNCVLYLSNELSTKLICLSTFLTLAFFSLLSIVKINYKPQKVNLLSLKGTFLNNRSFVIIFSLVLLMLSGIVPSSISVYAFKILINVYAFDKSTLYLSATVFICAMMILLTSLKIIQNCYKINKHLPQEKFHKKTAFNYAVSMIIIVFILIHTFL